jgi:hypothetical protein
MFIMEDCDSAPMPGMPRYLVIPLLIALCAIFAGCTYNPTQSAAPSPSPTSGTGPDLTITSPADGAVLPAGDITISVRVSNFKLVPEYGQPYVAGEGHLHYYLGVGGPAVPGSSSVIAPVTFIPTTATSITWVDVPAGIHTFSVELANNDHSPFIPPVIKTVTVTVLPATATTPGVTPGIRSCTRDADCVPEQCCHPTGCINSGYKQVCTLLCTNVCLGPIDCGAGHCGCVNGECSAVPGPASTVP